MSQFQAGDAVQFTANAIRLSRGNVPCGAATVIEVIGTTGLVRIGFGGGSQVIYQAHYLEKVEPQGDRQ